MKKIVLLGLALMIVLLAGCSSKTVTLKFSFGERTGTYSGPMKDGLPDGKGKFTTKNELGEEWTYEGMFKNGHFEGEGETTWSNGTKEIGTYKNDSIVPLEGDELKSLYTDAESFKHKVVKMKGWIFIDPGKVPEYESDFYFVQIRPVEGSSVNEDKYLWLYVPADGFNLAKKDYLEFIGKVTGEGERKDSEGKSLKAPEIVVLNYQKLSYEEALYPTRKNLPVDQTQEQQGFQIKLDKIEFADEETRIYLNIVNNSDSAYYMDLMTSAVVQDGQTIYPNSEDLEDSIATFAPKTGDDGYLLFPPLKDGPMTLTIKWGSDTGQENNPFTFEIKPGN